MAAGGAAAVAGTSTTVGATATGAMARSGTASARTATAVSATAVSATAAVGRAAAAVSATAVIAAAWRRVTAIWRRVRTRRGVRARLGCIVGALRITASLVTGVVVVIRRRTIAALRRLVGTRVIFATIYRSWIRSIRISATISVAFVEALHVTALRISAASPWRAIAVGRARAARVVRDFIVRRPVTVVAEAGRRAPTICGVALRFPTAAIRTGIAAWRIVVEAAAAGIAFRIGTHVGIRLVEREFALTSGRSTVLLRLIEAAGAHRHAVLRTIAGILETASAVVAGTFRCRPHRAGAERASRHV